MMQGMATPMRAVPTPAPTVGGRIRQARRFSDLSQAELGRRVGLSRESINAYEGGRTSPTVEMLLNIAREAGFPILWFVEDINVPTPPPTDGTPSVSGGSLYSCTRSGAQILELHPLKAA